MRVKQMENTLRHDAQLEELQVRLQRRDGSQPTVEVCRVSPTDQVGFSDFIQEFMQRNRLIHLAQEFAEPTGSSEATTSSAASTPAMEQQEAATSTEHHPTI